jgi:hypothetical protein
MSEAAEKSLPKIVEVTLDDGEVVKVEKLPLGRAAQLTIALKKLFRRLQEVAQGNTEIARALTGAGPLDIGKFAVQLIDALPDILEVAVEELAGLLAVATGLSEKRLRALGIAEIMALVEAVIEVNRVSEIVTRGKNMAALLGRGKAGN